MAEIINLRRVRKERERLAARSEADANAARHGRSKAVRAQVSAEVETLKRMLDGVRRDREEEV